MGQYRLVGIENVDIDVKVGRVVLECRGLGDLVTETQHQVIRIIPTIMLIVH